MAKAHYKIIAPSGTVQQCHGGNTREIKDAIGGFAAARLPARTRVLFFWGHRKNYRGELVFGKKRKAVLSEDIRQYLGNG